MNRIQHLLQDRAEFPSHDEFFVVAGEFGRVFVSREVAARLRATLSRLLQPRWLEFRDSMGALVRVRTAHVNVIVESTLATRAAHRAFARARDAEEESDRPPWDAC